MTTFYKSTFRMEHYQQYQALCNIPAFVHSTPSTTVFSAVTIAEHAKFSKKKHASRPSVLYRFTLIYIVINIKFDFKIM